MDINKIIKEFYSEILKIYKEKLVNVILYGSYARNELTDNSDIDIKL